MLHTPLTSDDAPRNAAALRHASEIVDDLARRLDERVDGLHYEGLAADRFRAAMAERSTRAHRLANELDQIARRVATGIDA